MKNLEFIGLVAIEKTVREYHEIKEREAMLKAELEPRREQILKYLESNGLSELVVSDFKVSNVTANSETFNYKLAKEMLNAEILKPFVKLSTVTRLIVRKK